MPRGTYYLIEDIAAERIRTDGGMEYLVKWLGYAEDEGGLTWEPRENFQLEAGEGVGALEGGVGGD